MSTEYERRAIARPVPDSDAPVRAGASELLSIRPPRDPENRTPFPTEDGLPCGPGRRVPDLDDSILAARAGPHGRRAIAY